MTEQTEQTTTRSTEALAAELRRIVDQAEELLSAAVGVDPDNVLGSLRDRVNESIGSARERLAELQQEARVTGRRAAAAAESWVRTNPWTALAIGAGVGLIIGGLLIRRAPAAAADDADAG